jgi:hypothetical protein
LRETRTRQEAILCHHLRLDAAHPLVSFSISSGSRSIVLRMYRCVATVQGCLRRVFDDLRVRDCFCPSDLVLTAAIRSLIEPVRIDPECSDVIRSDGPPPRSDRKGTVESAAACG